MYKIVYQVHCLNSVVGYVLNCMLQVWNCILHYEAHTFTGHMKAITGIHMLIACSLILQSILHDHSDAVMATILNTV